MSETSIPSHLPVPSLPVVAVFDFDGTMTTGDSFAAFLRTAVGPVRYSRGMIILSPHLLRYALGMIPDWQMKERVLTRFLGGWREEALRAAAEKFAVNELPKLVKPAALERLHWHKRQNHRTILVSGSPALYLGPWASAAGFDDISATHLAIEQGKVAGRILGENCVGPEKIERLVKLLGDLSNYYIFAYGDSRGDKELLARADRAFYRPF